jgi:NAD-dependent dihydropyrimidine dehydrogenase PreA subunit
MKEENMKLEYLKNISTLKIDEPLKCTGCGMCIEVCPHDVFEMLDRKIVIRNKDACMECGACQRNCPVGIIAVNAGVGCAAAIIGGMMTGSEASCDCSGSKKTGGCCG